jgi:hypothetical protein
MTGPGDESKDPAEKLLKATGELKDAITDAKAKLLLQMEAALKVGYEMRRAQNAYFRAKIGKQELLLESKRLESAFDMRLADLKRQGLNFDGRRETEGNDESGAGGAKVPSET